MVSTEVDIANIALQRLGQPVITTLTENSRDATICNQLYNQNRDYCLMLADWDCLVHRQFLTRAGKTTISGATAASPVVLSCATHTFVANELIFVESVAGMTQLNNNTYRIYSYTSGTITLYNTDDTAVDGTGYTAWTSGGYIFRDPTGDWEYVYDLPSDCLKVLAVIDENGGEFDGGGNRYEWRRERTHLYCDVEYAGVRYLKQQTDPSVYESDLVEVIASRLAWYVSMRIHSDRGLRNEIYAEMVRAIAQAKLTNAQGAYGEPEAEDLWINAR